MEKLLDSMVIVARGASRNVRIVRIYPLTALFTFTMVIIIYCILGLIITIGLDKVINIPNQGQFHYQNN